MEGLADHDLMKIDGTTSHTKRSLAEDEYQAGHVGVLIASIQAAGTSITLTRGNEALFAELDWTPDWIIQAEGRQDRIGQTAERVLCTTLIALGTLDERVADVLFGKSGVLEAMTGGDHAVIGKTKRRAGGPVFAASILAEMVAERIKKRRKTKAS
jgi:SNF2 family DNA or RNA helicase